MIGLGALCSIAVHELGHAVGMEIAGANWRFGFDFPYPIVIPTDKPRSNIEEARAAYAGFGVQLLAGTLLTFLDKTRDSDFTRGWFFASSLELLSYTGQWNSEDKGDFGLIERSGQDGKLAWTGFVVWNFWNVSRIDW